MFNSIFSRLVLKLLSPDPPVEEGGGGSNPNPDLPRKDSDFLDVAANAAKNWQADSSITLKWITVEQYADLVKRFKEYLGSRRNASGDRPAQTAILKELDTDINEAVEVVKRYIADKYEIKDASPYYAAFGIIHRNDGWELPRDRNERSDALQMMINACTAAGFGGKKYGPNFWTDAKARYDDALEAANSFDGTVSENAGSKNAYKEQINKVMVALRFVLRGNYPDEYPSVWRKWGWQKEDY